MEQVMETKIDAAMASAMVITAAKSMTEHWLASDATAAAHVKAGWEVAVEVIVTTDPITLRIALVDTDGTRFVQKSMQVPGIT